MPADERYIEAEQLQQQAVSVVDELATSGETLTILRHGKAVARLVPLTTDPRRRLCGSIIWQGDVISPIDEKWDADQ